TFSRAVSASARVANPPTCGLAEPRPSRPIAVRPHGGCPSMLFAFSLNTCPCCHITNLLNRWSVEESHRAAGAADDHPSHREGVTGAGSDAVRGPPGRSSDGDNDLAACATLSQVPDGLCNLAQRECSVDNRLDRACLQELAQYLQVIFARDCDQRTQLLTHEQREQLRPELAIDASEPLSAPFSSHDHERPLRGESAPQVRQGAV